MLDHMWRLFESSTGVADSATYNEKYIFRESQKM